ncbi:hypothetical protein [Gluconacetobacter entanii]|uniref:hypothetical protein n=1 Tax=Gluconacetobacter entanii TaxID=108528 RepID=UPI002235DB3E|nr:hypothetical protein [Gluconacetobacter entanii]MCW4581605.1 hypothetical protein [Gluconacetobacter entanii]
MHEESLTPDPQPWEMLSYAGLYLQVHDAADARRCLDVYDQMAHRPDVHVTSDQTRLRLQIGLALRILDAEGLDAHGHARRAQAELAPLLAQYPNSVDLHLAMGRVYQARGEPVRALAEDQAALKLRPGNIYALAAAARDAGGADDMKTARAYASTAGGGGARQPPDMGNPRRTGPDGPFHARTAFGPGPCPCAAVRHARRGALRAA